MPSQNEETKWNGLEIAIVGMACRFPQADNIHQYWENISSGKECISFFEKEDLLARGVPASLVNDPNFVPASAICSDIENFDAEFFGFFPREVEVMDPQQRLFLECCWQAWEDAGYTATQYDGVVGVFGGCTMNTYLMSNVIQNQSVMRAVGHLQNMIGNDKDFMTTRVSHKLKLTGPSYAIQSACSSSLFSIHVACTNLLNNECDMALAGGSSVRVPQDIGYIYQQGGTSSSDGHCRVFDDSADGSVLGNGCGIVVLKRLTSAIQDGDNIYAVIKGSAIGNDGADKPGYSTPSIVGQTRVINEALVVSQISANSIQYVEAHGTGTPIGDPIEFTALKQAFEANATDSFKLKNNCALGSVKANMGHLDAAAGVSGLIKVVMALHNKKLPPQINFTKINNKIDINNSPFYVNMKLKDWIVENGSARRASVTSIGLGGANAHVILEEAPVRVKTKEDRLEQLFIFSAKSANALARLKENLHAHLIQNPLLNPADIAYTLQKGREEFKYRDFIVSTPAALMTKHAGLSSTNSSVLNSKNKSKICFAFPGQGSQYSGMLNDFYGKEIIFTQAVDACIIYLKNDLNTDLTGIFTDNKFDDAINQPLIGQIALFIAEYALAKQLIHIGIMPDIMIGHSLGEYTAACIGGSIDFKDALLLVSTRAKLQDKMPVGAMLAIHLSEQEVSKYLNPDLNIAAINSSHQVVLAGAPENILQLETLLAKDQIKYSRLPSKRAFHSYLMDSMVRPLVEVATSVHFNPPKIPFASNSSGELVKGIIEAGYWGEHARNTVHFSDCVKAASSYADNDNLIIIEVGPGNTLANLIRSNANVNLEKISVHSLFPSKENQSKSFLEVIGKLWSQGISLNWDNLHNNKRQRLSLPSYPFTRKRFWLEPKKFTVNGIIYDEEPSREPIKIMQPPSLDFSGMLNQFLELLETKEIRISLENKSSHINPVNNTAKPDKPTVSPETTTSPQKKLNIHEKLKFIWCDLFGIKDVSEHDNAFDLGAHSLLMTQMMIRIQQDTGVVLNMESVMQNPVFSEMKALITRLYPGKPVSDVDLNKPSSQQISSKASALRTIWCDLLGIETIEENLNIFELGAHSLLLTQLLIRIQEDINSFVVMDDLIKNPDFKNMLTLVETKRDIKIVSPVLDDNSRATPVKQSMLQEDLEQLNDEELEKLMQQLEEARA